MWRSAVQVCLGLPLLSLGGLAQLARAPALQAGGQRFESVILHYAVRMLMDGAQAKSVGDNSKRREIFDILTHKTVSEDFKL